jgi:hypothetical protein
MRLTDRSTAFAVGLAACLAGCATAGAPASQPPKAATTRAEPEPNAPAPARATGEAAAAGDGNGQGPKSAGAASPEAGSETGWTRKASRPPAELITGPNLIYVFNFKESPIGQTARDECIEQVGEGGRELSACLEKARSKIPVESVRFIKKPSGELWWVTYNRYKGNLLKWHSVQFLTGEETAESITLKLIGKDKGIAPMARVPRSLVIDLPNDYTIVLNDPEFGPMTYDAKIGTLEDE